MTPARYVVRCGADGCETVAEFKIAAEWSDGSISELKTYGLACAAHLPEIFRRGRTKRSQCRLAEGERLSEPRIFRIESERRDCGLTRLAELEAQFGGQIISPP